MVPSVDSWTKSGAVEPSVMLMGAPSFRMDSWGPGRYIARFPRLPTKNMTRPRSHRLVVPAAHGGDGLDRALAGPASGVTRGEARRLIAAGVVFVGGRRCGICSRAVRAGETITWQTPARQPD